MAGAEERAHVLDRVDRHTDLADLAARDRVVGVEAHLGGQVEGDREAAGARLDEPLVALVGLRRGAEPGVLAHRPRPAGVHRRVDPTREREVPRHAQPLGRVEAGKGARPVDGLDGTTGLRLS